MTAGPLKSAVCVDSGVDYITATTSDRKSNEFIEQYAARLIIEERGCGNEVSNWFLAGYSGLSCGSVSAGTCGDSRVVQFSGHVAREHWPIVAEVASNVSRLDWQSTIRLVSPNKKLAEFMERKALAFEMAHHHGRQVELRRNSLKGKTLYLGSRKSDRFVRIYDKGAESKLDQHGVLWRAEIELHRKLAKSAAAQTLSNAHNPLFVASSVSSQLSRVGLPWLSSGAGSVLRSSSARNRCATDRKLLWLTSQVRGTVQYLIERGLLQECLKSLGLDQLAQHNLEESNGDNERE